RDPDPDPRVPTRGSARRAHAGRRVMAETGKAVDEVRDPWYHRWAGLPGEWKGRYRSLDERQRFQLGLVSRALIVLVLFSIGWPLPVFVGVIFIINYLLPRVPAQYSKYNRFAIPTLVALAALSYPLYVAQLGTMNLLGDYPALGTMVIMGVYSMMAVGLNI